MAGIHTINIDGSNDQQLSDTGYGPTWQSTNISSSSTQSTSTPGAPDTGLGSPPAPISSLLVYFIIGVILVALLLIARRLVSRRS